MINSQNNPFRRIKLLGEPTNAFNTNVAIVFMPTKMRGGAL